MRNKKAKALRKLIYGEQNSSRQNRIYEQKKNASVYFGKPIEHITYTITTGENSLRSKYQAAKRAVH